MRTLMTASSILAAALKGASVREVAARSSVPRRTVQGVIDGHIPSVNRAEQICAALGLELYIGPPRAAVESGSQTPETQQVDSERAPSPSNIVSGTQIQAPLTEFGWRMELPVREWRGCSPEGYLSKPKEIARAPAPVALLDDEAFYGQMIGQSMVREGIGGLGFYCLISPNTPLDVDERVWLRNRRGQEVVRRLVAVDGEAYSLRGWGPADEHGRQERIDEHWMRADVVAAGVVLAVYAAWPSVKKPPFRVPDVAGPVGQRIIRVAVPDEQLETLLLALVKHYGRSNEYSRQLFVAEIEKYFPKDTGTDNPHLSATKNG